MVGVEAAEWLARVLLLLRITDVERGNRPKISAREMAAYLTRRVSRP